MKKSHVVTALVIFGLSLTSGCASGGGGSTASDEVVPQGAVEMRIWNRSDRTIQIFARWGNAPRVRLGQLSGTSRRTYTSAVRGPIVAISWDVVSGSPPPATAGAGAAFPRVADEPGNPQCGVNVEAGDRVEWTIDNTGRGCSYVRLDPGAD